MKTEESGRVYIIILNYNGARDTIDCLESIKDLDYPDYRIVVVDNASTDTSVSDLPTYFKSNKLTYDIITPQQPQTGSNKFTLIKNTTNPGYAAGNNLGIRYALQDKDMNYVWVLNNDTVVEAGSLSALVERLNQDNSIGLCGSLVYNFSNKKVVQYQAGGKYNPLLGTTNYFGSNRTAENIISQKEVEKTIDYISGASVLASRDVLESIGLIGEQYFLFYEDVDWSLRVRKKYRLGYALDSVIFHKGGAAYQDSANSDTADFHAIKSRILLTRQYFPFYIPTVYLGILLVTLPKRLLRLKWTRAWQCLRLLVTLGQAN